jgi:hypothetical protein
MRMLSGQLWSLSLEAFNNFGLLKVEDINLMLCFSCLEERDSFQSLITLRVRYALLPLQLEVKMGRP